MGILIVYDVTDEKSFNSECLVQTSARNTRPDIQTFALGTSRSSSTLPRE